MKRITSLLLVIRALIMAVVVPTPPLAKAITYGFVNSAQLPLRW
jgi:hypothetical protein